MELGLFGDLRDEKGKGLGDQSDHSFLILDKIMGLGRARNAAPGNSGSHEATISDGVNKDSNDSSLGGSGHKRSSGKLFSMGASGLRPADMGNGGNTAYTGDSNESGSRSGKGMFSRIVSAASSSASSRSATQGNADNTGSWSRMYVPVNRSSSGKLSTAPTPPDPYLHHYTKTGQLDGFQRRLADHKGDLNSLYEYGDTILIIASRKGFTSIVKEILEYSKGKMETENTSVLNLEQKNSYGCTALMEAARFGRVDIVALLLDHGANLESKNFLGETALIRAACYTQDGVVNLLLARGAQTYGLKITPRIVRPSE